MISKPKRGVPARDEDMFADDRLIMGSDDDADEPGDKSDAGLEGDEFEEEELDDDEEELPNDE